MFIEVMSEVRSSAYEVEINSAPMTGSGTVDGEGDPLEADGKGDEGFVCGRVVAASHLAESVRDGAMREAEARCGFALGVAFGNQSEDPALVRGGVARVLVDGDFGRCARVKFYGFCSICL